MDSNINEEKLLFEEPELEFIRFCGSDIVTASGDIDLPPIDDPSDIGGGSDTPILDDDDEEGGGDEGGTEGGGTGGDDEGPVL